MKIERHWCMPSHRTFTIKPFKELIKKELGDKYIDPFPYPFTQDAIEYLKHMEHAELGKLREVVDSE